MFISHQIVTVFCLSLNESITKYTFFSVKVGVFVRVHTVDISKF